MHKPIVAEAAGLLLVVMVPTSRWPEQFLLMRHADRWDLPKGHREPGESLQETALRETEEETGILSDQIGLVDDFAYHIQYEVTYRSAPRDRVQKRVTYFIGRISAPCPVVCTEHIGYEWFPWQPPHFIQEQTIDPLLSSVHEYFVELNDVAKGQLS